MSYFHGGHASARLKKRIPAFVDPLDLHAAEEVHRRRAAEVIFYNAHSILFYHNII